VIVSIGKNICFSDERIRFEYGWSFLRCFVFIFFIAYDLLHLLLLLAYARHC